MGVYLGVLIFIEQGYIYIYQIDVAPIRIIPRRHISKSLPRKRWAFFMGVRTDEAALLFAGSRGIDPGSFGQLGVHWRA